MSKNKESVLGQLAQIIDTNINNATRSPRANEVNLKRLDHLDEFYKMTQVTGSLDKSIGNAMFGLSNNNVRPVLPENRDSYGMVFFTRPQLNMTKANLINYRPMYSLLNNKEDSVQRYVRCMLDPRLSRPKSSRYQSLEIAKSLLVNEELAFMPIFTNTFETMSGWPDQVLPTFTSKAGVRKEQYSQPDGVIDLYEVFTLDATFKNIKDEPLLLLLSTWVSYMANVFEGTLSPYMDMITEDEKDFETRIYRVVLDESKKFVKSIAATGASFPLNVPMGKKFDYSRATKYNDQAKEINIRFQCHGAMYNDDILIEEFNDTTAIFNPSVRNMLTGKPHNLEKVPDELLDVLNYRAVPVINTNTFELEWWINKNSLSYKNVISNLVN